MKKRVPDEGSVSLRDGGRLAYRVRGSLEARTPIVLLRPLGGSMALWGAFADALAREAPVIAFDPRGVDRSSDVPWTHSTRAMARDASELLDALGVGRSHVFGLSLGGMVASWLAADAPQRVDRLVLASTLPNAAAVSHRVVGQLSGFARALAPPRRDIEVALVHRILSDEFRRAEPTRVTAIEETVRRHPSSPRNLLFLALAAARHDATAALEGLGVKTLILAGRRDPIVGGTAERELLHDLPNARLEILEDAGHDLSLEAPLDTARRVVAFLGEDAAPGPGGAEAPVDRFTDC